MDDVILRKVAGFIIPLIQVYGFYIILHGHLSPGGAFAGGTIVAISMVLYTLVFGLDRELKKLPHTAATFMESIGTIWYVAIGIVGVLRGVNFLVNKGAGITTGTPGTLFSGGFIFLITLGIGIKVSSTIVSLFTTLLEEEEDYSGTHH